MIPRLDPQVAGEHPLVPTPAEMSHRTLSTIRYHLEQAAKAEVGSPKYWAHLADAKSYIRIRNIHVRENRSRLEVCR